MNTYNLQIENANDRILSIVKNLLEELGAKAKIISTPKTKSKLTINGYTEEFEEEVLRELKETERLATEGKIPVYDTDEKFYKHLADEYGYKAKK